MCGRGYVLFAAACSARRSTLAAAAAVSVVLSVCTFIAFFVCEVCKREKWKVIWNCRCASREAHIAYTSHERSFYRMHTTIGCRRQCCRNAATDLCVWNWRRLAKLTAYAARSWTPGVLPIGVYFVRDIRLVESEHTRSHTHTHRCRHRHSYADNFIEMVRLFQLLRFFFSFTFAACNCEPLNDCKMTFYDAVESTMYGGIVSNTSFIWPDLK